MNGRGAVGGAPCPDAALQHLTPDLRRRAAHATARAAAGRRPLRSSRRRSAGWTAGRRCERAAASISRGRWGGVGWRGCSKACTTCPAACQLSPGNPRTAPPPTPAASAAGSRTPAWRRTAGAGRAAVLPAPPLPPLPSLRETWRWPQKHRRRWQRRWRHCCRCR